MQRALLLISILIAALLVYPYLGIGKDKSEAAKTRESAPQRKFTSERPKRDADLDVKPEPKRLSEIEDLLGN